MNAGDASTPCSCKVGSVLERYEIADYDERLVTKWTDEADRRSIRELTDAFNIRVLQAAMPDTGLQTLEGEVENIYRLLTADDITSGMRTQTRDQLRQDSVPIDEVESDFVSHQTIYRHLTQCHGIERTGTDAGTDRKTQSIQTVHSLRGKTRAVTENIVERLVNGADVELDDYDVFVDVTIVCNECGRQHQVEALADAGGCPCRLDA